MIALGAASIPTLSIAQSDGSGEDFFLGGSQPSDNTVTIPLTIDGAGALLEVSVNGSQPAPFVFDTGSTVSLVDRAFAEANRVATAWGTNTTGAKGDDQRVGVAEGVTFQLGGITVPDQMVTVMTLPNTIADRGKRPRIAGLLGLNTFANRTLRLDIRNRRLTWLPDGAAPAPGGIVVPLQEQLGLTSVAATAASVNMLSVPVTLEGVTQNFVLDTGSGIDVVLGYGNARQLHARQRYAKYVDFKSPGGIDGPIDISMAFGNTLSIGPGADFAPPVVAMKMDAPSNANRDWFRPAARDFDGLIGLTALAQYVLFLDIPNQRLAFEPGGYRRGARLFRTVGICADKPARAAFVVLSTIKGTPAAQAGIAAGDSIVAVNGRPAIDLGLADFARATEGPGRSPVALTFADGRSLNLEKVQLLP